jgi:hypothetical protein
LFSDRMRESAYCLSRTHVVDQQSSIVLVLFPWRLSGSD